MKRGLRIVGMWGCTLALATSADAVTFCAKKDLVTGGVKDGATPKLRKICKVNETALPISVDDLDRTVRFIGTNVQIASGSGASDGAVNGKGNLIIGYDEVPGSGVPNPKSGSHNIVVGANNAYTSHSGIVAGAYNSITAPKASAIAGSGNTASGESALAAGGTTSIAEGYASTLCGGTNNWTGGHYSVIVGGEWNTNDVGTNYGYAVAVGGAHNDVSSYGVALGGTYNSAVGNEAIGGHRNVANYGMVIGGACDSTGLSAISSCVYTEGEPVVVGGVKNWTNELSGVVVGGADNWVTATRGSVFGGDTGTASGPGSTVTGGYLNTASGDHSSVSGGTNVNASAASSWKAGSSGTLVSGRFASP